MAARATLTDGVTSVALDFHFDAEGLISSVRAATRYRMVNGALVATPWQGRFWSYTVRDGIGIPLEGEVAWELPEGVALLAWTRHTDRLRIRAMMERVHHTNGSNTHRELKLDPFSPTWSFELFRSLQGGAQCRGPQEYSLIYPGAQGRVAEHIW